VSHRKISVTKNYRLFERHSTENRPTDLKKHKKLLESMKLYGFLSEFPVIVIRDKAGNMIVKDGQHRLMIAEMLGLPVYYIEAETDFDIAIVNSTSKVWVLRDYAEKFAANGLTDYAEGLQFAGQHGLPIGTTFALLAGTTTFGNCQDAFVSGEWRVKDLDWANDVASIYGPLVKMNADVRNARFIEACMSVCRVKEFKPARLIANSQRCREKLQAYSTREAYLDMLEAVYNFGRKDLLGLKAAANMAMKKRNACNAVKEAKAGKGKGPTAAAA
jgi:hypothetical protein